MSVLARVAAVAFAIAWLIFPGFGLIDLGVTVVPTGEWLPVVVLEAGWGLVMTVLVAASFITLAARPGHRAAAVQILVVVGALTVAALAGSEPLLLWLAAAMMVEVGLVVAFGSQIRMPQRPQIRVSWPFASAAAVGAVPWLG